MSVARKNSRTVQSVIWLDVHSSAIEDVDHDAFVAGLLSEVKRAGAHAPNCSVTDCDGCIERKLSSNGNTPHISVKEEDREAVLRVAVDGTESQTERAFAVRGYPLEVVVCERNLLSGFLMDSCIPESEGVVSSDRSEDQGRQEFDVLNRQ